VYAKYMDYNSQIFNVLGELAHLVRTIFTDGMHFILLICTIPNRFGC